jgi:hypothetical protein
MAKLRVGDIEIDGANVTIGGQQMGRPAAPSAPAVNRPRALSPTSVAGDSFLLRVGLRAPAVMAVGAALLAGGLFFYALSGEVSIYAFLFRGGLLASIGAGTFTLGLLGRSALMRVTRDRKSARQEQARADMLAVERALAASPAQNTVERLTKACALPEPRIVHALVELRAAGRVSEDLNTDTGEWYYAPVKRVVASDTPKSLDERLNDMERSGDR